jgi:hypothetical protein
MKLVLDSNLARLQSNFIRWVDRISDMRPAYRKFIPEFQRNRVGWNKAQRTVDGGKYAPLSPKYAEQKRKKFGRKPILIASGRLMTAVSGGQGFIQKIGKKEMTLGIDLPYASYPQDMTRGKQRNYFLTKNGTLTKLDYAQLLQAMEGKIEEASKAILNESLAELSKGGKL